MEWSELAEDNQPTPEMIGQFINSGLWKEINSFLQDTYGVQPQYSYSRCSAQRGWNVKYRKGGKSLCTLYPMSGFFIALVVVGDKELPEAERLMPSCSGYTQALWSRTSFSAGGRWLMLEVTDAQILDDVKELIKIRVKPR